MIRDFAISGIESGDSGSAFDICIIGAGAAGITLARQLKDTGVQIALLESGGADYEDDIQALAKGKTTGLEYYDPENSRLRFFGGTTAIWGGRVARLNAIDFEERDWVPHSGWPLSEGELRPYYARAQQLLDLPAIADNDIEGGFDAPLDPDRIAHAFWQFDEKFDRFTLPRCNDLERADNVHIILHATVTKLHADPQAPERIVRADIAHPDGASGQVRAGIFILATGGLEVPRLLLASAQEGHREGIGNAHDQAGRYFMEHPHARGARIETDKPEKLFKTLPRFLYRHGRRYGMVLRPGAERQRREKLLNTGFTLAVRKHKGEKQVALKSLYNTMRHELSPTKTGRFLWRITRAISAFIQARFGHYLLLHKLRKREYGIYAVIRAEQCPNPESRISLSDETDALGMPRLRLNWQLCDLDKRSVEGAMQVLNEELERLGLGRAVWPDWLADEDKIWEFDPLVSNHAIGGYHHMGTARMAGSAETGVCDAQARVFGTENLYIASSATFPTGGWANPTLTILALTLRLGDHLKSRLSI